MKPFIYISLLSQVAMFCLGSGPTKEEDLGEVWKMFEEGDTFSEYSKMLEPAQAPAKEDISEDYNILEIPKLDHDEGTTTPEPKMIKEREPYHEYSTVASNNEQQLLLSPLSCLADPTPDPLTLFYKARKAPPPTAPVGQTLLPPPPFPMPLILNQAALSHGKWNVPPPTLSAKQVPEPSLYNSVLRQEVEKRFPLLATFKLPLLSYKPTMPLKSDEAKAQMQHKNQAQKSKDDQAQKPHNPRSKKKIQPVPVGMERVLASRFPFLSLREMEEMNVVEKKITSMQSQAAVSSWNPWLEGKIIAFTTHYNPRSFKPAKDLGIVRLIGGPYACEKPMVRLSCYHNHFGINVAANSFQILPSMKRYRSKQGPKNCPTNKDVVVEHKPVNDREKGGVLNPQRFKYTSDGSNGWADPKTWDQKNCTEEDIKSILENGENEGGIMGKLENNHITVYSSGSSLYRAFIYNGKSISHIEPQIPLPIKANDVLFLVPDGCTGGMIKSCLPKELYTDVLVCMSSTFNKAHREKLWGDFVIATIGRDDSNQ